MDKMTRNALIAIVKGVTKTKQWSQRESEKFIDEQGINTIINAIEAFGKSGDYSDNPYDTHKNSQYYSC